MRNEEWRFWAPLALLVLLALYSGQKLVRAHIDPIKSKNHYLFTRKLPAQRGSIYDASGNALVKSTPVWNYHLDPVAITNVVLLQRDEKGAAIRDANGKAKRRPPVAIARTISTALGIDFARLMEMIHNTKNRYQSLGISADPDVYQTLSDSKRVTGLKIENTQVRKYLLGRRLSHVLGAVNVDFVGLAGIEQKYNKQLTGSPGTIEGMQDGRGRELYDKRIVAVDPVPGDDIYLTIDGTLQYEAETALADGLKEFGAGAGWCVVMDARSAAVLAMASLPDFDPTLFCSKTTSDDARRNRVTNFNYEPGSVMKVITAAAAFDACIATPGKMYSTDRNDERYYKLPGDGTHKWDAYMSVSNAIVHSSNIVIGKLGCDMGPKRLWEYMTAFGFGQKTGIELPGEENGQLGAWKKWDKATWSRAPIGQGVSVTAMQLASAYQAIANDGKRMQPHIVARIVGADGSEKFRHVDREISRPISAKAARTIREVMKGVATKDGTARLAALRGYTVAGKTGTAQKVVNKHYSTELFYATFIGIVPANDPQLVVLVTLDFDKKARFHQGGNSSAVIFQRLATAALRYNMISSDKPEEIDAYDGEDEFNRIMDERSSMAQWCD